MYELKTKPNDAGVGAFLASIQDEDKRADSERLVELMRRVSGEEPVMWGGSIIGFGRYHYRYATGHEGDMCRIGFSPRAKNLSLYLMGIAYEDSGPAELLGRLGKHSRGKGCLYLKRLSDADPAVLEELLRRCWATLGMGETKA